MLYDLLKNKKSIANLLLHSIPIFALLYLLSQYSYLLFHTTSELFTIVIACMVFVIAWSSRKIIDNNFFIVIGAAYLFIAVLDYLYTLSYPNMNIFVDFDANLPTQLWISARYMESISLLIATLFLKKKFRFHSLFILYFTITLLILYSIFNGFFPDAYIVGDGLTNFKIASEFIISIILFVSSAILLKNKKYFSRRILVFLLWSILLTIISEMLFTLYSSPDGIFNLLGHYFKIASFFLVYQALVFSGIQQPNESSFYNLQRTKNEIEIREKKYKDLFLHMSSGFALHKIIKDSNGSPIDYEYVEINTKFGELTGVDIKNAIGKRVTDLVPGIENDPANWIEVFGDVAINQKIKKFDQYSDALNKWFSISAYSPAKDYFAIVFEDITEQKKLDISKSEFISLASHQLKNPLTSTTFALNLLKKITKKYNDHELNEYLDDISGDVSFMNSLIGKLLNVSRIELGTYDIELAKIDLNNFCNDILRNLNLQLKYKKILLRKEIMRLPNLFLTDNNLLQNILTNLLSNAIKYTPKYGTIKFMAKNKNSSIVFSVQDSGSGIPENIKSKVFSKMYKSYEALKDEGDSSGLGLYIAKLFTEKLGGEIWFESNSNAGTTFFVELPLINSIKKE